MELIRHKDCGALFADDLGVDNSSFTYVITPRVKTPFGLGRNFEGHTDNKIITPLRIQKLKEFEYVTLNFKFYFRGGQQFARLFDLADDTSGNGGFRVWVQLFDGLPRIVLRGSGGNQFDTPIEYKKWYTYSLVLNTDTNDVQIFLNGVDTLISGFITCDYTATTPLMLGNNFDGARHLDGMMKDFIIYNRKLTPTEVMKYHTNNVFGYDKNLVSKYTTDCMSVLQDTGWRAEKFNGTNDPESLQKSPFGVSSLYGDGKYGDISPFLGERTLNKFSIFCWFRKTADAQAGTGAMIGTVSSATGVDRLAIRAPGDNKHITLYFQLGGAAVSINSPPNTFEYGQWVPAGFSFENGDIVLYTKDKIAASGSHATQTQFSAAGQTLSLGRMYSSSWFAGNVDKVLLFDDSLTFTQYLDLINRTQRGEL